jgi:hypothetical protein
VYSLTFLFFPWYSRQKNKNWLLGQDLVGRERRMPWGTTAGGLLLLGALAVAAVTLIGIDSAIELDGVRVVPVILQSATAPPLFLLSARVVLPLACSHSH